MTTGPQDPAAAGRDRLRACHADREQVLETLKDAFVHGRLTKDELDTRAGRALAARTYADLAPLTADIPPAAPAEARPPAAARRRPLARAVAGSGICLVIAAAAVRAAFIFDPGPSGPTPPSFLGSPDAFPGLYGRIGGTGLCGVRGGHLSGAETLPQAPAARPGPGGHAGDGERRGSTGDGPVPPGPRTGQTRTDLRAHTSRQRLGGTFPPGRAGHSVA